MWIFYLRILSFPMQPMKNVFSLPMLPWAPARATIPCWSTWGRIPGSPCRPGVTARSPGGRWSRHIWGEENILKRRNKLCWHISEEKMNWFEKYLKRRKKYFEKYLKIWRCDQVNTMVFIVCCLKIKSTTFENNGQTLFH